MDHVPVRRVLISTFDKIGLDRLAVRLKALGVRVASTGGTRTVLESMGLVVEDVSTITGFPEILDGRVKTLHPKIFAGILARLDRQEDHDVLRTHGVETFDAVIVNLYPFKNAVASPECSAEEAIELIDIGGPSLVRAAAKNHAFTAVLTSPHQYDSFLEALERGGTTLLERRLMAAAAFECTAEYDRTIANWMACYAGVGTSNRTQVQEAVGSQEIGLPEKFTLELERRLPLRYGENPHQSAAFYAPVGTAYGIAGARQISGKELSYNNIADLDAATRLASLFKDPSAIVVKHTNPCGAASAELLRDALADAMAADPLSAFGSVVAVNRTFDRDSAEMLLEPGLFIEVIAAPAFEPAAIELLTTRPAWKANVRLVELSGENLWKATEGLELQAVAGGLLAQRPDDRFDEMNEWRLVTETQVPDALVRSLAFAFTIVRRLTSNAIAVCRGTSLIGAGVGQTSRVDAVRHALEKARSKSHGAVLASDAFFPFPDSIELAAKAGIAAIIQPGGSKRDSEVIATANAVGIPMIFTSRRHFRH